MGIGDERDRPMLDKVAEHNRRVNRLGDGPTVADNITGRLSSINKQLENHLARLSQVLYRLAPRCDEATNAKDPEVLTIMQTLDMIQSKLHRLETLEENIDRLV